MKKTSIPLIGADQDKSTTAIPTRFKDIDINQSLVAQYVRVYLKNVRQGTASTKDRSQVIGTTKKMYKQKGTGNARHGSAKAPIFVGGGVAGGPKPRDYDVRMNQKQKSRALDSVVASRINSESLIVLSNNILKDTLKTKDFAKILKSNNFVGKCTLVIEPSEDVKLGLAARNIQGVNLINVQNANPYELLKGKVLLFSENAFSKFSKKE